MADDRRHVRDMTPAERAARYRELIDGMQRAADALPDEAKRGYRRERWPLITVAEMHKDLNATERLEMLQLLLKDYVGDESGRRILDGIVKAMSQD